MWCYEKKGLSSYTRTCIYFSACIMKPCRVFSTSVLFIIPCICLSGLGLPFFLLHAILASVRAMHRYVYGLAHVHVHTRSLHWVFFILDIFVGFRFVYL